MKWTDENKFDEMYEESIEQELDRLESRRAHDSGNNRCYDGTLGDPEKYTPPPRDYDDYDVKTGVITQQQMDQLMYGSANTNKPIRDVISMNLEWQWENKPHALTGEIQKIRKGMLRSLTQNYFMLGVETYAEFSLGLHPLDKEYAHNAYDHIKTHYSLSSNKVGDFKFCYWFVKTNNKPVSGFWMITIDDYRIDRKTAIYYANDNSHFKDNIRSNYGTILKL